MRGAPKLARGPLCHKITMTTIATTGNLDGIQKISLCGLSFCYFRQTIFDPDVQFILYTLGATIDDPLHDRNMGIRADIRKIKLRELAKEISIILHYFLQRICSHLRVLHQCSGDNETGEFLGYIRADGFLGDLPAIGAARIIVIPCHQFRRIIGNIEKNVAINAGCQDRPLNVFQKIREEFMPLVSSEVIRIMLHDFHSHAFILRSVFFLFETQVNMMHVLPCYQGRRILTVERNGFLRDHAESLFPHYCVANLGIHLC
jgi:hypothetical protein